MRRTPRVRRAPHRRSLAVVALAVVGTTVPVVPSTSFVADSLYPQLGNPGIDVEHYDLDLRVDHDSHRLAGTVTLQLTTTTALGELTLDSNGPQIRAVTVGGAAALYTGGGGKLRITVAPPVPAGTALTVVVTYDLTTRPAGDRPAVPVATGWFDTDGGSYVLNEPDGANTWLPSNDHPRDKATWRFHLAVPAGWSAIANGILDRHTTGPAGEEWVWSESSPMATYLVQLLTGHYAMVEGQVPGGPALRSVALQDHQDVLAACNALTARQIQFFETLFGPYPFATYGVAITDSQPGLAMETQERSLFSVRDVPNCPDSQLALAHELAHQWFGDAVSPADWGDIWLNESFATYGHWLWLDHAGITSLADSAADGLRVGGRSVAEPSQASMFDDVSYEGGAAVLHALRITVGDEAFFTTLRQWVQANRFSSRRTADFIALAERVSGRDLHDFFEQWLFAPRRPAAYPAAITVGAGS